MPLRIARDDVTNDDIAGHLLYARALSGERPDQSDDLSGDRYGIPLLRIANRAPPLLGESRRLARRRPRRALLSSGNHRNRAGNSIQQIEFTNDVLIASVATARPIDCPSNCAPLASSP